jgi:uncharacterized phage protein (TIGR01671 family)
MKMREIIFRGKRCDNGEWIGGSLVHQTLFYGDETDCYHILHGGEFDCDFYDAEEVIPETIGQFTGLIDKNGKKIFEGDIVRDEYNGGIARIAFLQQGCGWYLVFKNTDRRMGHRSRNSAYDNDLALEVIGNIHDNPELMEVSEDGK